MEPLYLKKKRPRRGGFWRGLFTGFFIMVLLIAGAGFTLYNNPQIAVDILERSTGKIITESVETLPKSYLADNKEAIAARVEQLTDAYVNDRLSESQIRSLGIEALGLFADRTITAEEVDLLLAKVDELTQNDTAIIKNMLDL